MLEDRGILVLDGGDGRLLDRGREEVGPVGALVHRVAGSERHKRPAAMLLVEDEVRYVVGGRRGAQPKCTGAMEGKYQEPQSIILPVTLKLRESITNGPTDRKSEAASESFGRSLDTVSRAMV